MRIEQIAVIDLFAAGFHGVLVKERLSRPCPLGPGLLITQFFGDPVIVCHPLLSPGVRNDLCAGHGEQFVITGLIDVIVRVEDGIDLCICRNAFERRGEFVARLRRAGVDNQKPVAAGQHNNVRSCIDDRNPVGDLLYACGRARLRGRTKQRRRPQRERPCHRPFQYLSAIHCASRILDL